MAEELISAGIKKNGMIIDDEGRAHVHNHSESYKNHRGEQGYAFNVNTGSIALTGSASATSVFYVKNNETQTMVIPKLVYIIGNSTSGAGDMTIKVIRNPTAGTLVSNATRVSIESNRNFGSANTLESSDIYKGTNGATITDGSDSIFTIYSGAGFRGAIDVGDIVLPKGSSLAVEITTQTSNSAMNVAVAAEVYLRPVKSDVNS